MLANIERKMEIGKIEQLTESFGVVSKDFAPEPPKYQAEKVRDILITSTMKRHLLQTLAQLIRLFPNEAQKMVRDVVK